MSKIDKLVERLKSKPKDFTWDELLKVLYYFGYIQIEQGKTGGSRRKFVNEDMHIISLHEPHPQKVLKSYQLDIIIECLKLEK
ncbi:type II toxin-antitoxin system HicA family toxin [Flavobacterium sp. ANB]|uniref:type II toxin-antitoxin system HicA family toxin n=1 Tax=unclassified Flavobacterium TaxID=196869 RepID=UPI0012B87F50|nr:MULTISPECIES: type II toxin-antitoxin system HicA family toxin [unclassified Flavobacterium]MBF4517722.1 type II toxin-antitoxin system HicA family toxin [Flavobacterium sp. ANB]MTD70449.1 addiction module toxin, HicA family [Flavobacterium sp. LC2016-13]